MGIDRMTMFLTNSNNIKEVNASDWYRYVGRYEFPQLSQLCPTRPLSSRVFVSGGSFPLLGAKETLI